MTNNPIKQGVSKSSATDFSPVDDIIGLGWGNLADQEFSPYKSDAPTRMAYRQAPFIYVVAIDGATGAISGTPESDRIEVSNQAAGFLESGYQGPEWGFNTKDGLVLVFTVTINGKSQIAFSRPNSSQNWSAPTVLTDDPEEGRMGASPSKRGDYNTQVIYRRWQTPDPNSETSPELVGPQQFYWMDLNERVEHALPYGILAPSQPPQFAYPRGNAENETCDLIFTMKDENGLDQIVRYDTSPGVKDDERMHFLTAPAEGRRWNHWDPSSFKAPEYPGRVVYAVNVLEEDEEYPNKMAIYTESASGEFEMLEYQGILQIPQAARDHGFIQISSVEQIVTEKATFFSVLLVKPGKGNPLYDNSTVWIWSLDGNLQRRVSGNNPGEGNFLGKDPEIMRGTDELFVYYNVYALVKTKEKLVDLHRCRTGVSKDGSYTLSS